MCKNGFNLRKVATIAACLAVITVFLGCEEDEGIVDYGSYIVLVDYDLMVMKKDLAKRTWSGARDMCGQLRLDGFSDWRLPSKGELEILYNERDIIGGFETSNNTKYWSSEFYSTGDFYVCMNFTDGSIGNHLDMFNQQPLAVRCVRNAFR